MNPADLIELALKLWPLIEKSIALHDAQPSITEAEARVALTQHVAVLQAKIQAELDKPPAV